MSALPPHLRSPSTGKHMLPKEVREERQRTRILRTAISVFAEKTYAASTVDDLVSAARIGVGSFYVHFDGKEDCFIAAYESVVAEAEDLVGAAAGGEVSWAGRTCAGLRRLLDWLADEPGRGKLVVVEIETAGEEALARHEQTLGRLAAFIRTGRAKGDGALPASFEESLVSGIASVIHHRLSTDQSEAIPALYEEFALLILQPILGEAAARGALEEDGKHSRS
jgi:AcrR family transcriptional regulator